MATMASTDLGRNLSDVLNRVHFAHEHVVITRHRRPVAVLLSIDDVERYCRRVAEAPALPTTAARGAAK